MLVQAIYIDMLLPETQIKSSYLFSSIGQIFEIYYEEIGKERLIKRKEEEEKSFISQSEASVSFKQNDFRNPDA
jgi:hypothetical protein